MTRNIICGLLLILFYQGTNAKLCELKKWYKDLTKDNLIASNLNIEQEELIEKIEKKIRNFKFSGNGKLNCDILDEYELILTTDQNRNKRKAPNKIKTENKPERIQDDIKQKRRLSADEDDEDISKRKSFKHREDSKKEGDAEIPKRRSFKHREDNKEEDDEEIAKRRSFKHREDSKKEDDEEIPKRRSFKHREDSKEEDDEDIPKRRSFKHREDSQEEDAKKKDKKDQSPKKDDEKSETQNKNLNSQEQTVTEEQTEYDPTESDVDETELLEEESPSSTEKVTEKSTDDENKQLNVGESSLHQREGQNASKSETISRFPTINQVCTKYTNRCSHLCYYSYQCQLSLPQYPSLHFQNKTKDDSNSSPTEEEDSDSDIKAVRQTESESDDKSGSEGTAAQESEVSSTADKQTGANEGSEAKHTLHKENEKPNTNESDDNNDIEENQNKDSEVNEAKHTVPMEETREKASNTAEARSGYNTADAQSGSNVHDSEQPQPNLKNIDILIQQRAAEHSTKINQLEILLMKLENKFLNQQLHKQNDSSSFSKLEVQIVKLENELLKLNQSYYKLSAENQILRNQERQRSKSVAALPEGNSTKHTELITQQQVRISQLTDWLTNQTSNLNQLQDKSESLAAQNQALYQIVMNQTALISNIMQKVQDLSDENLSYRKETQDLKSKIDSNDASVKILEKLESLGSKKDAVDVNQKQKPKQFHFLPDAPDASINRHLWKCNGLLSPQICFKYSMLLSPCPPFSTVYWRKCPKYIYEKTASYFVEFSKQFPNGTDAIKFKDKKETITSKPDNPNVRSGEKPSNPTPDDEKKEPKELRDDKKGVSSLKKNEDKEEEVRKEEGTKEVKEEQAKDEDTKENDKKEQIVEDDEDEEGKGDSGRPIKYTSSSLRKPKDCYEIHQRGSVRNGVYKIFLPGLKYYVDVYCDMKNGGWTYIQRRSNGEVDFFKDWKSYKEGFGVNTGEHYLGNDNVHFLTNQGHYSLHVELVNWKKEKRQAIYKDFWIDDEDESYKLHIEGYDGDAGDGLSKHNEMKFSTYDVDNDSVVKQFGGSCAKRFHGAGWYFKCYSSNLNGQYYDNGVVPPKKFDGVAWKPWTGPNYSLKEVVLKVRPKDK